VGPKTFAQDAYSTRAPPVTLYLPAHHSRDVPRALKQ